MLCAEPSSNEPGWESYSGSESALKYTRNIRRMNASVAMLGLLKEMPAPWGDVIKGHFFHKRDSIKKLLEKWSREDDGRELSNDGADLMGRAYYGSSEKSTTTPTVAGKTFFERTGEQEPH